MKRLSRSIGLAPNVALVLFAQLGTIAFLNAGAIKPAGFEIGGQVQMFQHLAVKDLQKLPLSQVTVSYVTGHGQEAGTYSGVLLWTLLNNAVLVNAPTKGALLRHTITVTGRDGYAVVLSAGELAPDFEDKSVIVAFAKDGQPLAPEDGIRLIVPGDKHGGRAVHDIVKIDVQ